MPSLEWKNIVKQYSSRSLSFSKDKLPAIAGVAKKFASQYCSSSESPGKYIAGLWENRLLNPHQGDLLWVVMSSLNKRPTAWRAPSFSWASVDGIVNQPLENLGRTSTRPPGYCRMKITGHHVVPIGPDEYGELSEASLSVSAYQLPAKIYYSTGRDGWEKTVENARIEVGDTHVGEFWPDYLYCSPGPDYIASGSEVSVLDYGEDYSGQTFLLIVVPIELAPRSYKRIGLLRIVDQGGIDVLDRSCWEWTDLKLL
jgi:hypothetical protein